MHTIHLIFTHHSELGKYNALALCNVIHSIRPDVIFEELSEDAHVLAYKIRGSIAVEIDAVKMYLEHAIVDNVPVDTYADCESGLVELHNSVANFSDTKESIERTQIINKHRQLITQQGLLFLNSEKNELLCKQENDLLHDIIAQSNDSRLMQLELQCTENIHKREQEIVNNIYRYSEINPYKQAIMFIGSGHRSTILKVIKQFELKEKLKLNWSLYKA